MKSGNGFLLVFSITSSSSLRELAELREQIVRVKDGDERVPLVLVGNKADLDEQRVVTRNRAFNVSQSWGGKPYYETSARKRTNVDEAFKDVCRQIIRRDDEMLAATDDDRYDRDYSKEYRRHRRRRRRTKKSEGPRCTIL